MNKSQTFTIGVIILVVLVLYFTWQTGKVVIDMSGMFNGVLQTTIGAIIATAFTIWVYRYLYHRKSKS